MFKYSKRLDDVLIFEKQSFAVKNDGMSARILLHLRSSIDRPLNGYLRIPVVITISVSRKNNIINNWGLFWMVFILFLSVFNTTFKNISVTTFVAEIGVPREIHRPVASH
jgi:hypothetical protein